MNVDMEILLLKLVLAWPLLLLVGFSTSVLRRWVPRVLPVAALPALMLAVLSPSNVEFSVPWLLLGVSFGIDEINNVFLLFISILWIAGSLLVTEQTRPAFPLWYLLTMTGSLAALLARDIPTFFFAYALMSLATFGLIFDSRSPDSKRAAKVYLTLAMIGEMVLLTAMIMVARNAASLDIEHIVDRTPQDLLMALLLIGFGIKSGIPLLHIALPPVYAVLPAAAAIPVAGGLLHMGLYGWLRFLPYEYPLAMIGWAQIFIACGLLAILFATVAGLLQRNHRALLAYSSISQMGLMTLMAGIMLASPQQRHAVMAGILVFALHHALAKGALFYGLEMRARSRLALWLPALSLAGLPYTSGALAKAELKHMVAILPVEWMAVVATLLPVASIGTTLLMARFLYLSRTADGQGSPSAHVLWWILLLASSLLPWVWPLELQATFKLWPATWPILVGACIAWITLSRKKPFSAVPYLPPGDVLVLLEKLIAPWTTRQSGHDNHPKELDVIIHPRAKSSWLTTTELAMTRWHRAIALLITIILMMFLIL